MRKPLLSARMALALLASVSAITSGCGKEEFVHTNSTTSASAVGYEVLAAKVDVLIVVDNTPGADYPRNRLQAHIQNLVPALAAKGWDYHIAAVPVAAPGSSASRLVAPSISNVLVSPTHNTETLPYSTSANPDYVQPAYAITSPSQLQINFPTVAAMASSEPAFAATYQALLTATRSNFLRRDAFLSIVYLATGNDTSTGSISQWANDLLRVSGKSDATQMQIIPVVAPSLYTGVSCWGGYGQVGSRYIGLAGLFRVGSALDFCSPSLDFAGVGQWIASQVQEIRRPYVTKRIVLDRQPRLINSVSKNGAVLPNADATRSFGWEYIGYRENIPTITSPYEMSYRTGWVIELYGDDVIRGTDTYEVNASY